LACQDEFYQRMGVDVSGLSAAQEVARLAHDVRKEMARLAEMARNGAILGG
jgi:hypothetical protein